MKCIPVIYQNTQYKQCLKLRDRILRQPLGLSLSEQDVAHEDQQKHFAVINDDEQVVACVVFKTPNPQLATLRQFAVDDQYQGQNLGRLLLEFCEAELKQQGIETIDMAAREVAVGFYEKLGYQTDGEYYTAVGIPHIKMWKRIAI